MTEPTTPLEWVEREGERLIADLRDCCRIPSVSTAGGAPMREMADWLQQRLEPLLDEVEQLPAPGAPPAVVGRVAGAGPHTVLFYTHYDVQPAEPLDAWTVSPFAGEIVDGALIARGAADDKADVMARLHAIEAFARTGRPLPCSIVWLSEGAEEMGSEGLGELLSTHRERFAADACLWESYLLRDDGRPEIGFGCRGMVYVELTLRCLRADQHSAFANVFRSAPAELCRAIATLTHPDGRVAIAGFHDDITPLDADDLDALATIEPPSAAAATLPGRDPFLPGDPRELARRLVTEPTANVAGLVAGHIGPGAKTVLPAEARAKLDLRIVAGQRPDRVVEQLRAHLDRHGFEEVEIEVIHSVPAAKSPIDFPLAHAVTGAARERFGEPVRYPMVAGAGPLHVLEAALGIPTVMPPGSTRMESAIHGPDERVRIDDYLAHVAFTIRVLERLGDDHGISG